jgi:SAM-dependent methyltransferase
MDQHNFNNNVKDKKRISEYYDAVAENYFAQYQPADPSSWKKYPQNYFRLQLILQRMAVSGCKSVYEVGTGEGTPLAIMAGMGYSVAGCDISQRMVELTRQRLQEMQIDPARVQRGDIEDSLTVVNQLVYGPFDTLIALGVMPHVFNDSLALRNMRMFLRKRGKLFIEFRNKLFSLFTFNRHTKRFILDDLLAGVADDVKAEVEHELDQRLAMDQPPQMTEGGNEVNYNTLPAKFHNPFEVVDLLKDAGFKRVRFHWYHYHPALPMLESKIQKRFWEEAKKLEHSSSWRGYFLCSAFVAEAMVA